MTATEERPVQILELFGGIGSPRCALYNVIGASGIKKGDSDQRLCLYDYNATG